MISSVGDKSNLAREELVHFLKSVPLFKKLSSDPLEALSKKCVLQKFDAGQTILEENVEGASLYIVHSGEVEVSKLGDESTFITLNRLSSRDYFGEMSIMTGETTSARIAAATACEVIIISGEDFNELLSRCPDMYQQLVMTLSSRLLHKEIMVSQLMSKTKHEQYSALVGKSSALKQAVAEVKRIFDQSHTLHIHGEKGVGKEAAASLAHKESDRSDKPFITIDCSQFKDDQWGEKLLGVRLYPHYEESIRRFSYLGLAEGGTVFLRNIDLLSPQLQAHLKILIQKGSFLPSGDVDVKLIMTSRADLKAKAESGGFDQGLYSLMEGWSVKMPPLRERKRDIPALVSYFVEKHSAQMNKSVREVDNEVMEKLLSHDYSLGNIQELEEVIERSIILTDGEIIRTEHLFLGQPAAESRAVYDFFQSKFLRALVQKRIWPLAFQIIVAAVFIAILYFLFSHAPREGTGRGLVLVWALWWPALVFSFFWLGRAWCGVCPMAFASRLIQRVFHFSLPVPSFFKKYDFVILTTGFLLIIWLEEVTHMRYSPMATAYLLVAILMGAVISGVIFQRQCWCRHLCPLGGMAGLFAQTSILELRANTAVCANKCTTHNCYTGSDSEPGCPMFQHLMFQHSNQICKLCCQCVANCPHDVVQLNLRVPGQELWSNDYSSNKMNIFVAAIFGALIPILIFQKGSFSQALPHDPLTFTLYFSGMTLGAIFLFHITATLSIRGDDKLLPMARRNFYFIYLPLLLGAYLAYQSQFIPGLGESTIRADFIPLLLNRDTAMEWQALYIIQGAFLIFGLLFSLYTLRRVGDRIKNAGGSVNMIYWVANIALMAIYTGGAFSLLTG